MGLGLAQVGELGLACVAKTCSNQSSAASASLIATALMALLWRIAFLSSAS